MRTERRGRISLSSTSFAASVMLAALLAIVAVASTPPAAHALYFDSRAPAGDTFLDGGWSYIAERKRHNQTRVIRRQQRHLTRHLVGVLKTKSLHYVSRFRANGATVAIGGGVYQNFSEETGGDANEFVAIADQGTFRMIALEQGSVPGVCEQTLQLSDVTADGRVIVVAERLDGLTDKCLVTRVTREVRAYAPDGSMTVLHSWTSSWGRFNMGNCCDSGPLFGSRMLTADARYAVTRFDGGELHIDAFDLPAGGTLPYELDARTWEMSGEGRVIASRYGRRAPRTTLYPQAMDFASGRPLNRPGMIAYFHLCGDKILEIARRGTKVFGDEQQHYWRVSLRDRDGAWIRTFKKRLRRSTNFVGCDGVKARFIRYNWDSANGEPRLPIIPLAGP